MINPVPDDVAGSGTGQFVLADRRSVAHVAVASSLDGRLDAVVVDEAGDVIAAMEAERSNHDPRVAKPYSENMRPRDFSIDTPGLTDVYTFQNLRDELDAP